MFINKYNNNQVYLANDAGKTQHMRTITENCNDNSSTVLHPLSNNYTKHKAASKSDLDFYSEALSGRSGGI